MLCTCVGGWARPARLVMLQAAPGMQARWGAALWGAAPLAAAPQGLQCWGAAPSSRAGAGQRLPRLAHLGQRLGH